MRVVREGFDPLVKTVDLQAAVQLQLTLAIAAKQENISVTGKSVAFANSNPSSAPICTAVRRGRKHWRIRKPKQAQIRGSKCLAGVFTKEPVEAGALDCSRGSFVLLSTGVCKDAPHIGASKARQCE